MAYDEGIAQRIRDALGPRTDVEERSMFGGVAFLINGNMSVGVTKESMTIRMAKEGHLQVLTEPHVRPMDFTGRPMKGWVYLDANAVDDEEEFRSWVARGVAYAESLPAKKSKKK